MDQKDTLTTEAVCPFLGLRYDRDTRYGFPNEGNHCHRERSPRTINLDYQEGVCLSAGYSNCPIYLHSRGGVPLEGTAKNVKVIPKNHVNDVGSQKRSEPASRSARPDGTTWTMLEDFEEKPAARKGGGLFSYGWFRLFFGLLLVVGSLSGMLLLMQQSGLGGIGSSDGDGFATSTPAGGVLPILGTSTPETATSTLLPTPTFTPLPSATTAATGTPAATPSVSPTATLTPTPTPSATNTAPPFIFPTNTPIPTWTPTKTPTLPPPTATPIPPTKTPSPPTLTPIPPTNTPISDVPTPTP